jgi:hypothetical protein
VVPLDYGYFLALQLLIPRAREKMVNWFRDEYSRQCDRLKCHRPSIVAHSLGSYLVAQALEKYPEIQIDRAIFCGAIIRRRFPWKTICDRGQITAVLNQFGGRDIWARLVEWMVQDAGQSGLRGFEHPEGPVFQQRNPEFRHGDYFYDLNFRENWVPFLQGEPAKVSVIADTSPSNWRFRITKAIVILAIIAGIVCAFCWRASTRKGFIVIDSVLSDEKEFKLQVFDPEGKPVPQAKVRCNDDVTSHEAGPDGGYTCLIPAKMQTVQVDASGQGYQFSNRVTVGDSSAIHKITLDHTIGSTTK